MDRSDSASSCSVRRSRRPQTRLETSCTRTGRPRGTPAAKPGDRTVGEGKSRTARMYVPEESHDGIVPMNHSNKDKRPLAESEEGRPSIKENACQPHTYPTQSGKGVSQGLAGVRKAARENKEMKFTALLHHLTVDLLRESFYSLKNRVPCGGTFFTRSNALTGTRSSHQFASWCNEWRFGSRCWYSSRSSRTLLPQDIGSKSFDRVRGKPYREVDGGGLRPSDQEWKPRGLEGPAGHKNPRRFQ
jgi:hypothetical protein